MRKRSAIGALTGLLLFPTGKVGNVELPVQAVAEPVAEPVAPLNVVAGVIPRNSTLSTALSSALPPADIHRLVEVARPVYDLARVSVGHPFHVATDTEGLFRAFTYAIDELKTLRVHETQGELKVEIVSRDYEKVTDVVRGTIDSSLFLAVSETGEQDQLAVDLADIFAWDVDFNTEIQPGDSFRVAVEKLSLDGAFKRYGQILAAEFVRGDRVLTAVRFDDGKSAASYYSADGKPLRKAFLRSPLRFSRISSGFSSSRLHPVLGYRRAHPAIDFAAPAGTPVMAAGNGVVIQAGWSGGLGKSVRLRHPNGYETLYGHLSRIEVRQGEHVSQGERIGAVGSTGLATGAHLDYRMLNRGAYLNPLRIVSPAAEPIPAAERARFEALAKERMGLLD
jgi:murein DD-endopeptidase MepM/ murein hydrolase activator NlpD